MVPVGSLCALIPVCTASLSNLFRLTFHIIIFVVCFYHYGHSYVYLVFFLLSTVVFFANFPFLVCDSATLSQTRSSDMCALLFAKEKSLEIGSYDNRISRLSEIFIASSVVSVISESILQWNYFSANYISSAIYHPLSVGMLSIFVY